MVYTLSGNRHTKTGLFITAKESVMSLMSNKENYQAIVDFFKRVSPTTSLGTSIKFVHFAKFAPSVSTFLGVSDADLSTATTLRNMYNTAESGGYDVIAGEVLDYTYNHVARKFG
jgi:hypothetical protein